MTCLTDMESVTVEGDDIENVYVWTDGVLERVWSKAGSLSASAAPPQASGASAQQGNTDVTTNAVTISVEGGQAPYTYAWTLVTAFSGTWSISNASSSATTFTASSVPEEATHSAAFQCVVTDDRGNTSTVGVNAFATNYGRLF